MKLTIESAHSIVEHNLEAIHYIPAEYENLNYYIQGSLRQTLKKVLEYISDKQIVIADHKYIFFFDNKRLTYKVRRKSGGEATSSRHMNLLCAIGMFTKQRQSEYKDNLIEANQNFFKNKPDKQRPMNVYSFRKYDRRELKRLEERARRLRAAGVTAGNFGYNILMLHGLDDLASEVFPANNPSAPGKKAAEYDELITVIDTLIDTYGYTTREQIKDNLLLEDKEIDALFRIFRTDLKEAYNYKRPTASQKEQWGLESNSFIYTKRG